jgi:hypothetical protein
VGQAQACAYLPLADYRQATFGPGEASGAKANR